MFDIAVSLENQVVQTTWYQPCA